MNFQIFTRTVGPPAFWGRFYRPLQETEDIKMSRLHVRELWYPQAWTIVPWHELWVNRNQTRPPGRNMGHFTDASKSAMGPSEPRLTQWRGVMQFLHNIWKAHEKKKARLHTSGNGEMKQFSYQVSPPMAPEWSKSQHSMHKASESF